MRGNSHVRCEAGEKLEIISKVYLSLLFSVYKSVVIYSRLFKGRESKMNKNEKAFANFLMLISVILGVLLLVVAGLLLFKPELLFTIVKTILIAACACGGILFLLTALVLGIVSVEISKDSARNNKKTTSQKINIE